MRRLAVPFLVLSLCLSVMPRHDVMSARTLTLSADRETLVLIIPPVENVSIMYEKFLPLREYLEQSLGRKVLLQVARSHQEAISSIGTGQAHIAYLDPSAYCEARQRYRVAPLAKAVIEGSPTYKSVIVSRKDSPVERIVDARGRRLALGSVWSSSSSLIPSVMFKEVGIGMKDFAAVDYLEQEDRIALSVLAGRHDVGGLSERVAMKYLNDGLKIIKTSEAIPQYSLCACPCLPEGLRSRVRNALLNVGPGKTPELARAMQGISGFSGAEDRDFDVVRVMIKNLTGKNYLEYGKNTVKVAILPLYSAVTLFDRFDPLMRYLSRRTGYEFKLVIPRDFEDFFATITGGKAEFSYSNPYIYIQLADKGLLKAFANTLMPPTGDMFRGIIIAHRDSPVRTINDLRGRSVMLVSYRSGAGFLAQQLYLLENGLDVLRDLRLVEGKRHEEVILNVYRRNVDAGFVRESSLEVLKDEIDLDRIRVLARTPYITNWPFAAARNTDERITALVQKGLMELNDSGVLNAAQVTGFRAASDSDYDNLRKWIRTHENR